MSEKRFRNATAKEWLDWLNSELTEPLAEICERPEVKHVLEGFREMAAYTVEKDKAEGKS